MIANGFLLNYSIVEILVLQKSKVQRGEDVNYKILTLYLEHHICVLLWVSEFSAAFYRRSNTSFVLVGVIAQDPPGGSVPWSMVATCWHLILWCLQQRHTTPRFFLPQVPPFLVHHDALYFWIQNLTECIELQSIFVLLWRSKGFVYMYFSILGSSFEALICDFCIIPVHLSLWTSALYCSPFKLIISTHPYMFLLISV